MMTQEQVQSFNENGYLLASNIYSDDEMDKMEEAYEHSIKNGLRDFTHGDWKKDDPDAKSVEGLHDVQTFHSNWASLLFTHKALIDGFTSLVGPNVALHHTKLFRKKTGGGIGFPMHQDAAWMRSENDSLIAAIVHISDATEDMGCLRVYPGTHTCYLPVFSEEGRYLNPDDYPISGATACPAKRGDVLFFHYLTVHGSGLNLTDRIRKTVLIQVQESSDKPAEGEILHGGHSQGLILAGTG